MILGRNLRRNALVYPDKIAIVEIEGRVLTHREFAERVFRHANGFLAAGLAKNTNVAILARNSAAYLEVYFGCGLIGACLVTVNYHLSAEDIASRLLHSEAKALIVDSEFLPVVETFPGRLRESLAGRIYVIGEAGGWTCLEEMVLQASSAEPEVDVRPEDPLYIGYTSGTTGPPKGAVISHRAIVVGFLYKALECSLTEDDVNYDPGPFWHSAPRDFASLAIYLGGMCVVTRQFRADVYLKLVERYRVTNSFLVPTMLQMVADAMESATVDCSSLKLIILSGSPLPTSVKDRVLQKLGPILFESYGSTETRMITSIKADELGKFKRCVGRAARDVEIKVMDADGNDLGCGEIGEIYVRGPGLFSGYYRDEERTRATHRGQWFSLGDMGRMDADGYLYLVDRKQDMIISGGENIFPNDVEEIVLSHPGVKEVAVIGTPHRLWGEQVTAVIVPEPGRDFDPGELMSHCASLLPGYMKLRRVEVVDELPRNPVGKILRSVLRARYWSENELNH